MARCNPHQPCLSARVLVAPAMGRQDCLGSTMMLQRRVLEDIGGLQPLEHDRIFLNREKGIPKAVEF
jgi:hypothetical protein